MKHKFAPRFGKRWKLTQTSCAWTPLGNLIVRKGQRGPNGLKIMLAAHIDEIGIIVTHVDGNGFVRFTTLGGVRPHTCVGGRVRFLNGTSGVISMEPLDDPGRVASFDQMYIDLGLSSNQNSPVKVGDVAAFERPFLDLGERVVAKSLDDRIGAVVLIEALRQLKETPHELYFVFSVQEEVGVRGATAAAFGVDPDLGLAVDVTGTGDTPRRSGVRMQVSLGKGPAIKVRDGGMLADPGVIDWMVRTAEQNSLPYQLEILEGGSTDAARHAADPRRRSGGLPVHPFALHSLALRDGGHTMMCSRQWSCWSL